MSTQATMQMPNLSTDNPVASILSPKEQQIRVNEEINAELQEAGVISPDAPTATAKPEVSSLFIDVMEQRRSPAELSPSEIELMGQQAEAYESTVNVLGNMSGHDVNTIEGVQSVFDDIRTGKLDLSSASPSAQRNIALMAGNCPAIPAFMANSARVWAMDTRRDPNAGAFTQQIGKNFAARQAVSGRYDLVNKGGEAPVAETLIGSKGTGIETGMDIADDSQVTKGWTEPEPDAEMAFMTGGPSSPKI